MLMSPSQSIPSLVSSALSNINTSNSESPAHALLRALSYAIRWESAITPQAFLSDVLAGEQWLVWAAGNVCLICSFLWNALTTYLLDRSRQKKCLLPSCLLKRLC